MTPEEYAAHDALGLKILLDKGEVSAKELHEIAVQAIERLNPELNFLVASSPEDAQKALDYLDSSAPFAGVPALVKDGVGMAGQPASMGCRLCAGIKSEEDIEFIRRLKKTGVVILGSTNAPELANSFTTESLLSGSSRNPWNTAYSSGGSSGGASAAVAAGVVPLGQGGDGAGSIRVPAHCCGVFGLMPSRGRNPTAGYGGLLGVGRKHIITRSVRDSAAMLDCLHGAEPGALFQIAPPERPFLSEINANPGRLKVAFSTASPSGYSVDPECVKAVEKTVHLCESLGHQVEEATPDYDWDTYRRAFYDSWAFGYFGHGINAMEDFSGQKVGPDTLEPATLRLLEHCQKLSTQRIAEFMAELAGIGYSVGEFYETWDVLLTPVCLTPAAPLGKFWKPDATLDDVCTFERMQDEYAPFTSISNVCGQPSLSIPLHQSADGLPVGVLCTAGFGQEAALIRLAAQLEQACPWINRRPPVSLY